MNSSVFENAMQAATHSSAIASAIESTSLQHIAKSMSAASQFDRYANVLSREAMMPEATSGLAAFDQVCGSANASGRLLREELGRITDLQRTQTPASLNNFADVADQTVSRHASNQLTVGAREATAKIDALLGPRAIIDSCRLQSIEDALPRSGISSITGTREAELLGELLDKRGDEDIVFSPPISFDPPCMQPLQRARVSASDLSEPRRSEIGHQNIVVLERALRCFICQHMQEAFGENWLSEKVPGVFRKKWMRARAKKGSRASEFHLIEFADFGHYVKLITDNDDVWSAAFETVLGNKEETIRLLDRLNRYRRDTSHSRKLSAEDLVALHSAVVELLMLIAPDAISDLSGETLFEP